MAVLDVVATSLEGGGPTLPLWARVVTWMVVDMAIYSLVNFFGRNVARDNG